MNYLVTGLREGFRISFDYETHQCRKSDDNMRSAQQHPQVVRNYALKECEAGRLLGLFDPQIFPEVHVSRFGVIPIADPGSWRLILDLSSPDGASMNDGINPNVYCLSYITVDDAARAIERTGTGAMLAKVDIKSAYPMISIHSEDRPLLAMTWEGGFICGRSTAFWVEVRA